MTAILSAQKRGLLGSAYWLQNLTAGIVVGVVALPLAMAFAIASGAEPQQGLYTAIVAGAVVSLFGGSSVQIAGPTGAFVALLAQISAEHGISGLMSATFLAGLMLVAMGLARLGSFLKFMPLSVIYGFTAGIGVVIALGQCFPFLGLPAPTTPVALHQVGLLVQGLSATRLPTALLGCFSLFIILVGGRGFLRRVPGPLAALALATAIQTIAPIQGLDTIGSVFGGIPQGLPSVRWLALEWDSLPGLLQPALAIAMLGAIESLLSASVADGMLGTRHDSNQELIGQGLANLFSPLFGGFAATGAIARTATNIRNGGNSPLAGLFHCVTLLLMLVFLAPLAQNVPLTTLAAILLVVAWNMSDFPQALQMLRSAPGSDKVVLLVTFFLTIFTNLLVAVQVGVLLACLDFLRRMTASVAVSHVPEQDLAKRLADMGVDQLPAGVVVYEVQGPFFFAAVERFEQTLESIHAEPQHLVLWFGWVPFIDSSAVASLSRLAGHLQKKRIQLTLCGLAEESAAMLVGTGIPRQRIFDSLESYLTSQTSPESRAGERSLE